MLLRKLFGDSPHSSVVIDIYKPNDTDCRDAVAEKIVFGVSGCERCMQDAIAQLIATDAKFAAFVRGCIEKAYPIPEINSEQKNDNV